MNEQEKQKEQGLKKSKTQKVLKVIAIILAFAITFTGGYFSKYIFDPKVTTSTTDLIRLIEQVGYIVDENGNEKKLTKDDYLKAIADGVLDDYSKFYTKQEYEEQNNEDRGDYSGFGLSFYESESVEPIAKKVIGNSPADKSGLRSGDKIVSAIFNDETTEFSNTKELGEYLASFKKGDSVKFNVERNGTPFVFTIKKAEYKASYVTYFDSEKRISFHTIDGVKQNVVIADERIEILGSDVALIRLDSFEGDAPSQLAKAIECMRENNRTKLILDLRDNGGGFMRILTAVARHLIYNGAGKTLIAYSKGKTENESYYMENSVNYDFIEKIAVIANEGTASASECLIGAMLYYGKKFSIDNLVIEKNSQGTAKTYGKGIMQTTYKFLDGSALKITTAKILWPDKETCIHLKGILPKSENATEKGLPAVLRAVQTLN